MLADGDYNRQTTWMLAGGAEIGKVPHMIGALIICLPFIIYYFDSTDVINL